MTAVSPRELGQPWRPPEPRDLPDLRARLAEYTTSMEAMAQLRQVLAAGRTTLLPTVAGLKPETGAAILLSKAEEHRLRKAQLYYASADMTALAVAAANVPPTEPVRESRVPEPFGLMVFASPIGGYAEDLAEVAAGTPINREGVSGTVTIPIVAVSWERSWTPHNMRVDDQHPVRWHAQTTPGELEPVRPDIHGVWLTFYAAPGAWVASLPRGTVVGSMPDGSPMTAGDVQDHPRDAPLNWDNETLLTYGVPFGEADPDTSQQWSQVVYTAWQLMGQQGKSQLTEVEEVPRNRDGRKRDQRAGITSPQTVRVVNVHIAHRPSRAAAEQDEGGSTGRRAPQWTCRWPVPPYRRYTCLNPRAHADGGCEHEDRIVAAHYRGPADMPLRVPQTVRLWDHQPED